MDDIRNLIGNLTGRGFTRRPDPPQGQAASTANEKTHNSFTALLFFCSTLTRSRCTKQSIKFV